MSRSHFLIIRYCYLYNVVYYLVYSPSHFSIIRFPLNLYEFSCVTELNSNNNTQTVHDYAKSKGFLSLSYRALDSKERDGNDIRFETYSDHLDKKFVEEHDTAINRTLYVESMYPVLVEEFNKRPTGKSIPHKTEISWANIIINNQYDVYNPIRWQETLHNVVKIYITCGDH